MYCTASLIFYSFVRVLFCFVIRCAGRLLVLQPGIQSDWQCKIVFTRRRSPTYAISLVRNYRYDFVTLSSSLDGRESVQDPHPHLLFLLAQRLQRRVLHLPSPFLHLQPRSVSQQRLALPCLYVIICLNWCTFSYLILFYHDCWCWCCYRGGGGGRARREDRQGLGWPRKPAHGRALVRSWIPTKGRRQYQGKRK